MICSSCGMLQCWGVSSNGGPRKILKANLNTIIKGIDVHTHIPVTVSENLMAMWTNFAKHGDPTPGEELGFKWKPKEKGDEVFLDIDGGAPEMKTDQGFQEKIKIWREVYQKIGLDLKQKSSPTWSNPMDGF